MNIEDEKLLNKILNFIRMGSVLLLVMHCYWFCHKLFVAFGFYHSFLDNIFIKFQNTSGMFDNLWITKLLCLLLLFISCMGNKGKKNEKIKINTIILCTVFGTVLFFLNFLVFKLTGISSMTKTGIYCFTLVIGYILLLSAAMLVSRLIKHNLMKDVFNAENESFMQETRILNNPDKSIPNIHLPTKFYYKKQWHDGCINVVNPHRATNVLGTPGSGKSFAVINNYIKQLIEQGNALYIYDYKYPTLTDIAYNHFRLHPEGYTKNGGKIPKIYIINFDDPRRSHRCNPLHPSFLKDITDAFESAHVIMMNLNRTWIKKQGEFFVESPIILLAAIIWFLKIYKDGKYCTFPHAIEFLNKKYTDIFTILSTYPELENLINPFMDAWEGGAQDQLQGQIASAKIPLAKIISKELYWILSGDDFTLDINNPEDPKILCLGNNPKRETIYATALGLYNFRIVQIINDKGKQPCGVIVDELPTMYFGKIDRLIGTARSNKIAVCLGFQDYSQLTKDYGKEEMEVIVDIVGNVFAGQVLGSTAKGLSERFGKILQKRQSININKQDTSTSISTQMDMLIPAGKISNLPQGTFVGSVAEDFGVKMIQNIFHAKIVVDIDKIKKEEAQYKKIPIITRFVDDSGVDRLDEMIDKNYTQIKTDVTNIVNLELNRITNDPNLSHLIKNN